MATEADAIDCVNVVLVVPLKRVIVVQWEHECTIALSIV